MNWIAKLIGHRWAVCSLLFFATTINYIDRQILSLLKPILDDQLHWTNAEFGMVNSAFQGAYGVSLLVFGWLIDKYGTKIGYSISIAAWSLAAMGHALVGSVGGFLWARVALGLGDGGNYPAAIFQFIPLTILNRFQHQKLAIGWLGSLWMANRLNFP